MKSYLICILTFCTYFVFISCSNNRQTAEPSSKKIMKVDVNQPFCNRTKKSSHTCPEGMVHIPAGTFVMGSDQQEREIAYSIGGKVASKNRWYDKWELPKQTVNIGDFCIDKTPVTNESYRLYVAREKYDIPFISNSDYQKQGFLVHKYSEVRKLLWKNNIYPENTENNPVVLVSYSDAQNYCGNKGDSLQTCCRLPSEAEWEKSARGPNGNYYPWGNEWHSDRANYGNQIGFTSSVDKFPNGQSHYGILEMAGNVFEWTMSKYSQEKQVLKSCSWDDNPGMCRGAARHGRPPESRHILFGFRCVCRR